MKKIRNFSIIAHINHGKTTLSDRIIQICGGLNPREMTNQVLDTMDLEKERGITIKAQNVSLKYKSKNGEIYKINLIDTPGHIDFSYEVYKSLIACEGVILLIDSTQGIEAQTISNYYKAVKMNLDIIIVLNKIDLLTSNIKHVSKEIKNVIGYKKKIINCSSKTGEGIINLLENIISNISYPKGKIENPLQAIIIDSWFDNYRGIISIICIKNGIIKIGDKIIIVNKKNIYNVEDLGIFTPKKKKKNFLICGEVGWLIYSIKNINDAKVGNIITSFLNPTKKNLYKFKEIKPQIYAALFPTNTIQYKLFSNSIKKLKLNDNSFFYEPITSSSLGLGFRCGFLGLLHLDIIKERLEREYNLNLIITTPNVIYEIYTNNKKIIYIDNPNKLTFNDKIKELREPIAKCNILTPKKYLGKIIKLCIQKRGIFKKIIYYNNQIYLIYEIPMSEIIIDFLNKLKSITNGYASLNYNFKYYKKSDLVKINILINKKKIDAISWIIHKKNSYNFCIKIVEKFKKKIPRQQFDIFIQASINSNIIYSSKIKQFRKNVITKCYGGDISRKKKLLKKQKIGKKKMKKFNNITLTKEMFLIFYKINNK
ncbi:translation elongation factor 4 [Enterobacteriaceae bacterium ET-AT1-13]|nr:translation elongation factor 4 [Enterobacteriaceae bacterium ET-AT1-13]WGS66520.1 translation elongation factor 4 [Enterobacteriaceae bacterium Cmel17]WMC17544.1 MAG: translation elongation factor 4 [Enterobacteriaceae bacterium Cmel21]WMC17751.1 MAG: translation elongation factor 4 [Enterobacteriaceae bacterium PSmelAO3-2]WMC17955.1 MAG: translation elongation factor 4 [Enterobacteriaceae bacterium PSmelAO3-1]WMC18157.1 MAG: translation elongation factor 4 [Enterobacteriaceae bacterium PS